MNKEAFSILVVDDDPIVRDVLSDFLKKEGYIVDSAFDGDDGIKKLLVKEFDIVITDLRMPGADGMDVLKNAIKLYSDISVIILTAYGTLETAIESTRLGAFGYLTKPFYPAQISHLVERAAQRKMLLKENSFLRKILRETYQDIELLRKIDSSSNVDLTSRWFERMEKLHEAKIIDREEVEKLKKKLVGG